jgi:hypothetical protein
VLKLAVIGAALAVLRDAFGENADLFRAPGIPRTAFLLACSELLLRLALGTLMAATFFQDN